MKKEKNENEEKVVEIEKEQMENDNKIKEGVDKGDNKNKESPNNEEKQEVRVKSQKIEPIPQYGYHYVNQKCKVNPVQIPKAENNNRPIQKSKVNSRQIVQKEHNKYYFDETETKYLYQKPKKNPKTSQNLYTTSFARKEPSSLYLPNRMDNTFKLNKLLHSYYQDYSKLSKRHKIIPKSNCDEIDYYPEMYI